MISYYLQLLLIKCYKATAFLCLKFCTSCRCSALIVKHYIFWNIPLRLTWKTLIIFDTHFLYFWLLYPRQVVGGRIFLSVFMQLLFSSNLPVALLTLLPSVTIQFTLICNGIPLLSVNYRWFCFLLILFQLRHISSGFPSLLSTLASFLTEQIYLWIVN